MKRIFTIILLFSYVVVLGQKYNIAPFGYFTYGKYLMSVKGDSIVATLDKNYFSVIRANNEIFISDSSTVYILDTTNFSVNNSFPVMGESAGILQLIYLTSNGQERIYAIGRNVFDTVKLYKINSTGIVDSVILGKYNAKVTFSYTDSAHCTIFTGNVNSLTDSVEFIFRRLSLEMTGITSDTTTTYKTPLNNFSYPVLSLKTADNGNKLILISSANTYVFRFNQYFNILGYNKYPVFSAQATMAGQEYLFIANDRRLYRLNISTGQYGYISFNDVIKSIAYLPNASLLLSFFSSADTAFIKVNNPYSDNLNEMFIQWTGYSFLSQPGGRLNYTFTTPWFDFLMSHNPTETGLYTFYLDSTNTAFIPDTIQWYVDGHFIGNTTKDYHSIEYRFFRQGTYKISAKGIYPEDNISTEVTHFLVNPYDVFPDVIPSDTFRFCQQPDTILDISAYTKGRDSIVWYRNKQRFAPLFNQSQAHITLPGEYYVYIYLVDTTLSDTVTILYTDKIFPDSLVKIYINESPYDSLNNTYCTNDGLIYFQIIFPPSDYCQSSYITYWNFGDGYLTRTTKTYIDHKYYKPGTYTVIITVRNTSTGGAYNFVFPIKVSINPITKYIKETNIQKLSKKRITIGREIIVEDQKVKQNNVIYVPYGHQIFDSAEITIPIPQGHYQSAVNQNITFFALLSSNIAEGTEIKLYNSTGQEALVMPDQRDSFATTSFFYGNPKIDIPNYPHKNESFYHYYWNDQSSLTFWYMTHTNPSTAGIFNIFNNYLQELELLDIYHYQVYPITLHPYSQLNDLNIDSMGTQWKVKFKVHPYHSGIDHITVKGAGLILPSYQTDNHYIYQWSSNMPYTVYGDTILEINSQLEGNYYFSLQVTDIFGCQYKTYTKVYVLDTLAEILPNVFTPNDDGSNDFWDLRSAFYNEIFVEHAPILVKIWDKHGRLIRTFIANDTYGWDGRDAQGRKVPPGTYWYLITVANKIHIKGFVSVIY